MPLSRGDVILVQFPYATGAGSKLRPAVVVQPDYNNRKLTNVILAPLTTTIQRAAETTQFLVEAHSVAGKAAGLRHTSVVSCENLTTVAQSLVRRRLGKLPQDEMDHVNECLKVALGLA